MAPVHFLVLALQCLLPIFKVDASEYLGLSIVNSDTQGRQFTVTATPSNGANAQTGRVTLNPGAQRVSMLSQILGAAAPSPGWISIDSDASTCANYLASGSEDLLAGTDADPSGSTALLLPHISINTGFVELSYTDTEVLIVNAGNAAANVTAQLIGLDGAIRGAATLLVPAKGSVSNLISDLFRQALPDNSLGGKTFEGYAKLSADAPISAWQRVGTPLSRNMLRAVAVPAEFSSTIIPHFVFGGNYESFINVVNPGPSPTNTIEFRAFNDQGNAIGETIQLTLKPGEARRVAIGDLFRIVTIQIFPPPIISGAISIRQTPSTTAGSPLPPLFVNLETVAKSSLGKAASMMVPMSYVTNATRWQIPFAVSAPPYFSGYAIANANELLAVQNDVMVEVLDATGRVVSREAISLSPRSRRTGLIPPNLSTGYLRFTATSPIYVMGTIGMRSLQVLDSLPAIPQ